MTSETNMKIKIEVEVDTESNHDLDTIEELIELLRELADKLKS